MNEYLVRATLTNPGCYNSGYEYTVLAANKVEAIKRARGYVRNDGHTRQDGPLKFSATEL